MTTPVFPLHSAEAQQLIGRTFSMSRTVGEFDVLSFAGVTGDLAANHTDHDYMLGHGFEGRIAHGVLLLGYTSSLSTRVADQIDGAVVSLGYDRVRFTSPVVMGTTITSHYTVREIDTHKRRIISEAVVKIAATGTTALVATHIMKAV
ncbi:MaoC family dehydratase [Microbacterium sp. YY-01]|uniref:MaoC family dehydratase n=1 Tax=Microbacterium sp. YY-01 TaxID=3421634 RepID=UPI003D164819